MSREMMNNNQNYIDDAAEQYEAQRLVANELEPIIDVLRSAENPNTELDRMDIRKLDLSPADLKARLNAAYWVAVDAQISVERQALRGASDEELTELQARADVIALIVTRMGSGNKAVASLHSDGPRTMSSGDFKVVQAKVIADHCQPDDPAGYRAAKRIARIGYEFDKKPSFIKNVMDKPAIVQTTGALALAAMTLIPNAAPAAAATETTNANPTKPGANDDDILSRKIVQIKQTKVNPVVDRVEITPAPDERKAKNTVIVKKSAPINVTPVVSETKNTEQKAPVVVRKKEQRNIEIKTVPLAEQKNKGGNVVRVIPPASVAPPATIQETTPTPAPAPEQQKGPYVLNAEQNGIIDSLNLSPAKKDFLRQAVAGAIGLQQHGAKVNPEVVIAQAALESGWGQSGLTKQANNYFGMKAGNDWKGKIITMPTEEANPDGSRYVVNAVWPVFESAEDCFAEYAKFIERLPHFADALEHPDDPAAYVAALVNGPLKYATDPEYETKIMGTIKANHLSEIVGIAHKVQSEKAAANAAAEAQRVAAAKAAEEEAAKKAQTISNSPEVERAFTGWGPAVEGNPAVTAEFGIRGYDAQGKPIMHTGKDYQLGVGNPFLATADGTVSLHTTSDVRAQGWCQAALAGIGETTAAVHDPIQKELHLTTVIDGVKYVTVYAHMSSFGVEDGTTVKKGQVIGKSGDSGCSTGPHAHIEFRRNGTPINPNLMYQGDSWKNMNITSQSVDGKTENVSVGVSGGVSEDYHIHVDGEENHTHEPAEVSDMTEASQREIGEVSEDEPVDEQQRWIEAVKKAAELKNKIDAEANPKASAPDGYLSVAH
jgi:flagellum-specific peptidoglycan hydrolase FlgJ